MYDAKEKVIALIIAALAVAGCVWGIRSFFGHSRSVVGIGEPVQKAVTGEKKFDLEGDQVTLKYLYSYDIEALVVHTCNYNGDSIVDHLSPRDLALAWGSVAANNKEIDVAWQQAQRFYSYACNVEDANKIGGIDEIGHHSSNNHIIPATDEVKKDLMKVKTGDHIRIQGYLVRMDAILKDGSHAVWESSTDRLDSGDGACEVIYANSIEWLK